MSFDFQALMQGFLETKTADIQERKQEARNYKDRMRAIADRNAAIAQQRTSMYTSSKAMGDQLLKLGATPDLIQSALKSGQDGLTNLYKTVQSVNTKLGPEEAKSFLKSDDFVNYDLGGAQGVGTDGLDQLYKTTVGLPTGAKIGDYKAPDATFIDKLFGKEDYTAKAKAQLDEEQGLYGGYSVYDLTTIGTLPDYMAGSQGEIFTISAPKIYTSEVFAEEASAISKSLDALKDNPSYTGAVKRLEAVEGTLAGMNPELENAETYKTALEQVKVAKAEINGMLSDAIRLPMTTQGASYYNSADYYTQMAGQVANTLGFVPEWLQEEIEAAKVADEVVKQAGGGGLAEAQDDTAAALGTTPVEPSYTIDDGEGTAFNVVTMNGVDYVQTQSGTLLGAEASGEIIKATKGAAQEEPKEVLGDNSGLPGFRERDNVSTDYDPLASSVEAGQKALTDAVAAGEATGEYLSGMLTESASSLREMDAAFNAGAAKAYAFLSGLTGSESLLSGAKSLQNASERNKEQAAEIAATGFLEYLDDTFAGEKEPADDKVKEEIKERLLMPIPDDMLDEKSARGTGKVSYLSGLIDPTVFKSVKRNEEAAEEPYNPRAIGTVGSQDLGLREDVRDRPAPSVGTDSPSELDVPPASQVSAVVGTGADRRPNNVGLMSPGLKRLDKEQRPVVQEGLETLVDNGVKVHGTKSKTAQLLKKVSDQASRGASVKASDITKLIRDTSKLPKTDTRDTLLMQLYELRDTLNNR